MNWEAGYFALLGGINTACAFVASSSWMRATDAVVAIGMYAIAWHKVRR